MNGTYYTMPPYCNGFYHIKLYFSSKSSGPMTFNPPSGIFDITDFTDIMDIMDFPDFMDFRLSTFNIMLYKTLPVPQPIFNLSSSELLN